MKLLSNYKALFRGNPLTRYITITGGRGSAKSFHVSTFLLNLTYEPDHVILFTRWTMTSAHISIIPEFTEKIELLNKESDFDVTKDEIVNKLSGSRILFRGIKTSQGTATANLKSIQGVTTWVIDEAEELTDEDVFDRIDLSIRSKKRPNRVIIVMNPSFRAHFIYKRFLESENKNNTHIHTTYLDNKDNLSESFLETATLVKSNNELRYNHLFLGEWLDTLEGIFWTRDMLERQRIPKAPMFDRIIVAIDPSTTNNANSDECGIIVAGKAGQHVYIIEDLSGKYSPAQWSALSVSAAKRHGADCIIAESNQGGDMVKQVIRQHSTDIRVKLIHATKGKQLRAEPVFGLYEEGRVWHVGEFVELEQEMCIFDPANNPVSPNRVDAAVYAVMELAVKNKDVITL